MEQLEERQLLAISPLLLPLDAAEAPGNLLDYASAGGAIEAPDGLAGYTIGMSDGEVFTVALDPAAAGQPTLELSEPTEQSITGRFLLSSVLLEGISVADTEYARLSVPDWASTGQIGQAELPMVWTSLVVPAGVEVLADCTIENTISIGEDYLVYPKQPPEPDGVDDPAAQFAYDADYYRGATAAETDILTVTEPAIARDTSVVLVGVAPVQYEPVTGEITVVTDMTFSLSFLETGEAGETAEPASGLVSDAADADYLIITADSFYDEVLPLAEWKHMKGFKTYVAPLSTIGSTSTDVFNFIDSAYHTGTPTSYVLLVGDYNDVPSNDMSTYISDHPYACVAGTDYLPDLTLGRLSVHTEAEATTVVDKILTYERTPDTGDWYDDVLNAGYFQDYYPSGADGYADRWFMETTMHVREYLQTTQGMTSHTALCADTSGGPPYYYRSSSYPHRISVTGSSPYPVPASVTSLWTSPSQARNDISTAINGGVGIVQHRDHGGNTGWGDPPFYVSNVNALTNGVMTPVVFSTNCSTGTFNYSSGDCFAEALQKHSNGGAIGIVAATRTSYSGFNDLLVHGTYTSFWPDYDATHSGNIYPQSMRPAEAMNFGKYYMYMYEGSGSTTEIEFHEFHWFGDPEMMLRTATPLSIAATHTSGVILGQSTDVSVDVTVGGSPVEDALVCISKDNSSNYWVGTTDATGNVTFLGLATSEIGDYDIVATAFNGIPYEGTITSIVEGPWPDLATPVAGSTVGVDRGYVNIEWNDFSGTGLNTATIDAGDISIPGLTIGTPSLVAGNTYQYPYTGSLVPGPVDVTINADQVQDNAGDWNIGRVEQFTYEVVAITTSPVDPAGGLIYQGSTANEVILPGDEVLATIDVDDGQTITVVVDPDATLQPTLDLFSPTSTSLATAAAGAAGEDAVMQTIHTVGAGTYTIVVSGASSTTGTYTAQVILNAAAEAEEHNGPTNNDAGSAETLDAGFVALGTGFAERGAVVGTTSATDDWYSFVLDDGQSVSQALTALSAGGVTLELLDGSSTLLAAGRAAGNSDQVINSFVDSTTNAAPDTYFLRVAGDPGTDYSLVVAREADFDAEPNDGLPPDAQQIMPAESVLGHVASDDWYSIEVVAGDTLYIATSTPAGGPYQFVNDLDPAVELYDPSGTLVASDDNSAPDGRNAQLTYPATLDGTYTVRVLSAAGSGEYFLEAGGASGGRPALEVVETSPDDGQILPAFPLTCTLDFSESILLTTIEASDLVIGGQPALSVTVIDGDTIEFEIDPAVNIGDGVYSVVLAADAVADLEGSGNLAFTGTFVLDTTGPTILSTLLGGQPLPGDAILPEGPLTLKLALDEDIAPIDTADVELYEAYSDQYIVPDSVVFDSGTEAATIEFALLAEGIYTLTLFSGDGALEDLVGNDLDGEPLGPNADGTPTGDGTPGGDYQLDFMVDRASIAAGSFERLDPPGGLMSDIPARSGLINSPADEDDFTLFAEAGQTIAAVVYPDEPTATLSLELVGVAGPSTSAAPGEPAVIDPVLIPADGNYTVRVSGDVIGTFRLEIGKNLAAELFDTDDGAEMPIDDSFVSLGSGRYGVIGSSKTQTVLASALVWGVQPAAGQILKIDPASSTIFDSFPTPDAISPTDTHIGLSIAEGGDCLLYFNADVDPFTLYRLDPVTGTVLSTETPAFGGGAAYEGLGCDRQTVLDTIFDEDFDGGSHGFTFDNTFGSGGGLWHTSTGRRLDNLSNHSPPNNIYFGQGEDDYTGGNYATGTAVGGAAISPVISLPAAGEISLSFNSLLEVESGYETLEVVANYGTGTTTLLSTADDTLPATTDAEWVHYMADLSSLAGSDITIEFTFETGDSIGNDFEGWFVDDVLITSQTEVPLIYQGDPTSAIDRQYGFSAPGSVHVDGSLVGLLPVGGLGGDDADRQFAFFDDGLIHEYDPFVANTVFSGLPSPAADIQGMAFDGTNLYACDPVGNLYTLDPDTGDVLGQVAVPGGGLFGLGAFGGEGGGGAGQITTMFDSNNGQDGNMFDVTTFDHQVTVTSLDVNLDSGTRTLEIYTKPGTYVGYETDPSAWTLVCSDTVTSNGQDVPTPFDVTDFVLPASAVTAFYVTTTEGGMNYTNGSNTYSNTDLRLDLGVGKSYPFGSTYSPRTWNGTIHYESGSQVVLPDRDEYQLDLTGKAGHRIDLVLAGQSGADLSRQVFQLLDVDGVTVLETAAGGPLGVPAENYDLAILDFEVPANGVYTLRTKCYVDGEYGITVTDSLVFDSEPNDEQTDPLRSLDDVDAALGCLGASADLLGVESDQVKTDSAQPGSSLVPPDGDCYQITLTAGSRYEASTQTPLDDPAISPSNDLNPELMVFSPGSQLVASDTDSAPDGKNALTYFIAPETGTYLVWIGAESGSGEYLLRVVSAEVVAVELQIDLYTDDGGSPGALITDDTVYAGESFFVCVTAADRRGLPEAGLIGLAVDLSWNTDVLEEIDVPFDPDYTNPDPNDDDLVTTKFPLLRGGTLDNAAGSVDELQGSSLPAGGQGEAIGAGDFEAFSIMHFQAEQAAVDTPLALGLGDGSFAMLDQSSPPISIENQTLTILANPQISVADGSGLADDHSVQFGTALTQYRPLATADSPLVRPDAPNTEQYVDVTNCGYSPLVLYEIQINAPSVTTNPPLTSDPGDDIVLPPGHTQRFELTYAPTLPSYFPFDPASENFCLPDGLVILSDATNDPDYEIGLRGVSTFNSDVNYDARVNLGDLGPLNANWGKTPADPNWDPTADINGDDVINLSDFSPLTSEFGLSLPLVMLTESDDSTEVVEGGAGDTYTLVLNREPTGNVDVTITPDAQTQLDVTLATFTPADWDVPQTITVTAVDDAVSEGTHFSYIVHTTTSTDTEYDGLPVTFGSATAYYPIPRLSDSRDLIVTVEDNDPPPGGVALGVALASCQCSTSGTSSLPEHGQDAGVTGLQVDRLQAGVLQDAIFGSVGNSTASVETADSEAGRIVRLDRPDETAETKAIGDRRWLVAPEQSAWTSDLAWIEGGSSRRQTNAKKELEATDLALEGKHFWLDP